MIDGVHIVDVGRRSGRRAGRALITAARVFAAARQLKADIYHFHDPELLPWGFLLRQLSRAQVIYDSHEHLPEDICSKRYLPAPLRRPFSRLAGGLELLAVRGLSAVVAATPHIHQRFVGRARASVSVCNYPLAEEQRSPLPLGEREMQACYVGGISFDRGVRELAAAADLCRTRIVLAGPLWDGLTPDTAGHLPGWASLSYRGVLSRAGVADVIGASRVGIVTFLPAFNYVNAGPNKMFEYMQAGIPVVASDFPLWREIVASTGCGICVDPRDPADIAAAIDRLAGDPEFALECGRNGARAVAGKFNWSTEALKLIELYKGLQRRGIQA
jgi:glycosyltransferase involved in cell wall biosynthesis